MPWHIGATWRRERIRDRSSQIRFLSAERRSAQFAFVFAFANDSRLDENRLASHRDTKRRDAVTVCLL